jgi:hypothetical protein
MNTDLSSPTSASSFGRTGRGRTPRPLPEAALPAASFRRPTSWCDANDPSVRRLAAELTSRATTPREAAAALFHWVRDEIAYTMGDWNRRASETLALRIGTCSNKANLLVALARAIGLSAGFHVQYIATDAYFAGGFTPTVRRVVRDRAIHVYVAFFLDGRWVKCDPTDDRALCESIQAIVPHAQVLVFDGVHDAMLPFRAGAVLSDEGPFADIDEQLARAPRISPAYKRMFGAFIEYMRDRGARYVEVSEREKLRIDREFRAHFAALDPDAYAALVAEEASLLCAAA